MEFQDRNAGEEEFSQAIIENLFLLKDGSVVMGCHVVCGTVHRGDRFYYVDCVGRECFAVTVADIAVPKVGSVEKISAGEENARQAAIKVAERVIGKVHPGHMLQSEPEEVKKRPVGMRLPNALKSVIQIRRFRHISAVMRATSRMKWGRWTGSAFITAGTISIL